VSMYNGIDMISIPRNNINKVLKEDAIATPHKTKNIKAKYSEICLPTFSISLPFHKKLIKVQKRITVLKCNPNLSNRSMSLVSILNSFQPRNSRIFTARIITSPAIAQYFGTDAFLKKTPPNIITTPQTADKIIAPIPLFFIYQSHLKQF